MTNSWLRRCLFVLLSAFLSMGTSASATTIFSENFNEATVGLDVTSAGAFQAIDGTNVDVLGGAIFGYLCAGPESGNCVDMSGSGGNPIAHIDLKTLLNLAAGTYDLSCDLIGSGRGQTTSTTVSFGSYCHTFALGSGDITSGIVADHLVTLAGGPTQLQFFNNGAVRDGNIGALLDNITVDTAGGGGTSPAPEPLVLMATGLVTAAGLLRRGFYLLAARRERDECH